MLPTVSSKREVQCIANSKVDHSEKALILLFEFLLVEDLYGDDAGFFDVARVSSINSIGAIHFESFVPVWIDSLLDDRCGMCLFSINCHYCKRIRKS